MTKSNKAVIVTVRMTELQLSQLEYVQEPGETRSDTMRRLVNEKWCDQNRPLCVGNVEVAWTASL